jgi:hypothetical protein
MAEIKLANRFRFPSGRAASNVFVTTKTAAAVATGLALAFK